MTSSPSAEPALLSVRRAVRRVIADLGPGDRPIVAVSGGPDSLAMAAAVAAESGSAGLLPAAVVVDHGLQSDSTRVAELAAANARSLGLDPVEVVRVAVPAGAGSGGPEAAARDVRREALRAAAERIGSPAVLLGHTLDDQAETVLLGLVRGSGPRSLAGMAPVAGLWRRPLLTLRRALVRAAAAETGLPHVDDPHNRDPAYLRSRTRHDVLPLLEDRLGPGVATALARTADLCRADADALDLWADAVWADAVWDSAVTAGPSPPCGDGEVDAGAVLLDVAAVAKEPPAVRTRVWRRGALAAGCPASALTREHVLAVDRYALDRSVRGGPALPGRVRVERRCGRLWLGRRAAAGDDSVG